MAATDSKERLLALPFNINTIVWNMETCEQDFN